MALAFTINKSNMIDLKDALPGRMMKQPTAEHHFINGRPLTLDVPELMSVAIFGMGCFWGVERIFWGLTGVHLTMVGYASGFTPNPTYQEVCTGKTGHNEVVRVVFDPRLISYDALLQVFWESHDPTQGMSQGNDVGTQYRSGIYYFDEGQRLSVEASKVLYQKQLLDNQYGKITTEVICAGKFYFAEDYHQQYLAKNPMGYCGIGGTGVLCPVSLPA